MIWLAEWVSFLMIALSVGWLTFYYGMRQDR
jgi:hypothetical protein